ncbi:MAG: chemotaxis protein CheW [Deltaproteobacteria bacterium]
MTDTESARRAATGDTPLAALAGKYMTFKLASECYGLRILKVRELIGLMEITRVPKSRAYMRGVINLRGKVIPVLDLRMKFDMGATEYTDQTVIIVVQHASPLGELTIGVLVDEVLEVIDIDATRIEPAPTFGSDLLANDFILGVGKTEKRVLFLLDIDQVLSAQDERVLAAAAGATSG